MGVLGRVPVNAALSSASPLAAPSTVPTRPPEAAIRARASTENFPVALRVLPAATRRHLLAVYGFARLADELGDAPGASMHDRLAALDWLDREVAESFAGRPTHPITRDVSRTLDNVDLPEQPFHDLIEANRLDQRVARYETFEELVAYCALSANPVGRLVLAIFAVATPERVAWSDRVCTGLQLVDHWQDVREDFIAGRVYLPAVDRHAFAVREASLGATTTPPELRTLVRFEVARAREWLIAGVSLVASLHGWARVAITGYVAGGLAACERINDVDGDVLAQATTPAIGATMRQAIALTRAARSAH
jgi:squalene synthase HpnC